MALLWLAPVALQTSGSMLLSTHFANYSKVNKLKFKGFIVAFVFVVVVVVVVVVVLLLLLLLSVAKIWSLTFIKSFIIFPISLNTNNVILVYSVKLHKLKCVKLTDT